MYTEFKLMGRRFGGRILGWGVCLALYSLLLAWVWPDVSQVSAEFVQEIPDVMAFFGGLLDFASPHGYLQMYYFSYMSVVIGILALGMGAGLLVNDEEQGILDMVLAHPISRSALFWGRYLGLAMTLAAVILIGQLGWILPPQSATMGLSWIEALKPLPSLFAVLLLFGSLALFLSMVLPSGRLAVGVSAAALVGNYLLVSIAILDPAFEAAVKYTPLHYYQGGLAILGINWGWLAGLLAGGLVLALAAWALFLRRDIRVGGEHEWELGSLLRRRSERA